MCFKYSRMTEKERKQFDENWQTIKETFDKLMSGFTESLEEKDGD